MDRVCVHKTGKLIELQSGGDDRLDLMSSRLNTLKQNAIKAGYKEEDIEVKWATPEEVVVLTAPDPIEVAAAQAKITAKLTDIIAAFPSWEQMKLDIGEAFPDTKQQKIIRKIAKVVNWLAKDSNE